MGISWVMTVMLMPLPSPWESAAQGFVPARPNQSVEIIVVGTE
jgi:hypothetical protein